MVGIELEWLSAGICSQTPVDKKDNYASGVDGTAIRCVLRKAAHEKWGIAAVDVKGAFLLAPRKETRRTLITRPPQILLQAGLCGPKERWWVKGAMYLRLRLSGTHP